MIRAQELIVQASNDVLGPSDREAIALEVDEMRKKYCQLQMHKILMKLSFFRI